MWSTGNGRTTEQNRTLHRRWAVALSIGQLDGNSTRLAGERSEQWCSMTLGHVVETEIRLTHPPLTSSYILYIQWYICVEKSLMIWPDVVFAHHESPLHQVVAVDSALGRNSSDYELTFLVWSNYVWYIIYFWLIWLNYQVSWRPSPFGFWLICAIMLSLKQTPSFVKLSRLTWNVPNYLRKKC